MSGSYISRKDVCLHHVNNSPNCDVAKEYLEEVTFESSAEKNLQNKSPFVGHNKINITNVPEELFDKSGYLIIDDLSPLEAHKNKVLNCTKSSDSFKRYSPQTEENEFMAIASDLLLQKKFSQNCQGVSNKRDEPTMSIKDQSEALKNGNFKKMLNPERSIITHSDVEFDFKILRESMMARLKTFGIWPKDSPVIPEDLAKEGFIYLGSKDKTKCVFCFGVLSEWEFGDVPAMEHVKHFPFCNNSPYVNKANLGINSNSGFDSFTDSKGELDIEFLKHNYMARLETFKNWPPESPIEPVNLASEGFIYLGKKDMTKCVFCLGILSSWEVGDIPAIEHSKYMPFCNEGLSSSNHGSTQCDQFPRFEEDSEATKGEKTILKDVEIIEPKVHDRNIVARKKSSMLGDASLEDLAEKIKSLKDKTNALKERKFCKLCMDNDIDTVFLPCGHLISCKECAPKINKCPICRKLIRGTVQAFIPDDTIEGQFSTIKINDL